MSALERRCRSLLRAYPAWYRAERGDEILGTLLEASGPDRSWPASRDATALILGGLRVRAWQHRRQTMAAAVRQAVLLAAVLDLAFWSARDLGIFAGEVGHIFPSMLYAWAHLILGLLTSAAMAGAWFGRRTLTAVVSLAAAGLWLYLPAGNLLYRAIEPVLALAVLAILAFVGERLPRSWLWLAGVWYLVFALPYVFQPVGNIEFLAVWVPFGIVVGVIGWSVIDARLLLATTLAIGVFYSFAAIEFYAAGFGGGRGIPWDLWPWFVPAVIGLAVAALAVWRVRRQAVL